MGIAKFFAYISERYPALNEKIRENQIPEFDNLYLDMNGIIHVCTHPKDKDIFFLISEEEMYRNIFHYIETLFYMIKPKKLFFLAVDGVAPRAKINQQRSRRFCAARSAEMIEAKAIAEGNPIPEDQKFDSNCITPGTVFMYKLNKYLKYFVVNNISTNKLWQRCKVIFSGSEVAGEGEHKIMDYIRYMKSQPDYDINTRHCLYGLDADLIMLGLCTHELHLALLREEVIFGKKRDILNPGQAQFFLFHISLLRDYIDHEFASLKEALPFPYDIDKIIDDWILIAFLIGNDFIPHVPNIYILTNGIPILYEMYKQMLPTFNGYINEGGTLNLERFEKFMEKLSHLDILRFSETYADLKYLEGKISKPGCGENEQDKSSRNMDATSEEASPKKTRSKELEALIKSTMLLSIGDPDDEDAEDGSSDNELHTLEFAQHKKDYYINKLHYDNVDEEFLQSLTEDYIRAIQWNLYYYYEGCPSWTWYYPHHYAPYISDLKNFKDLKLEFEIGEPFLPFEQLLAVLPPYSRKLLPPAFQNLLTEEESPIISYYPVTFETDLNGKVSDWEAVVLIPFINGDKLRDAMVPHYSKVTDEERDRNKHAEMCVFTHTKESLGVYKAPAYFPDVANHAQMVLVDRMDIVVPREKLVKGLSPGVQRDVLYLGFASLMHVEHTAELRKAQVRVFNRTSRWENMMLQIPEKLVSDIEELPADLLGKTMFVNWPYLKMAKIVGVSDGDMKITLSNMTMPYSERNVNKQKLRGVGATQWKTEAKRITDSYRETRGIDLGEVDVLIHACLSVGGKYSFDEETEKFCYKDQWFDSPTSYPYQVLVRDLVYHQEKEDEHKDIADVLTPGTICFLLSQHHYGAMGEVLPDTSNERWKRTCKISLSLTIPPELSLTKIMASEFDGRQRYMTSNAAAMMLGISSFLFSKITGTVFVTEMSDDAEPKLIKHNIGFELKFNKKNEEVPGYTRKMQGQWFYSNKTVDLVREYMKKYPELFERLWKVQNDEFCIFHVDELFDKGSEQLKEVVSWLKENHHGVDRRTCGADILCPDTVKEIEKELDTVAEKGEKETKRIRTYAKSWELFVPLLHSPGTLPDPKAKHKLFDRVISVRDSSAIPLGHRGVIVGIQRFENAQDTMYDVLFEKAFPAGIAFNGCSNFRGYRLPGSAFLNISHGIREPTQQVPEVQPVQTVWKLPPNQRNQIHSNVSAFASLNVKNVRSVVQTPKPPLVKNGAEECFTMKPETSGNQQCAGNTEKKLSKDSEVSQTKRARPASEFQALWNELHEKQKMNKNQKLAPPQQSVKLQKPGKEVMQNTGPDPSAFLRAILKISDVSTPQNKPVHGSILKPLTTLPPPGTIPISNRVPSLNSSGSSEDKAMGAPPLVKQMFDHARLSKETTDRKPPAWYCSQLLNYYQLSRLGMPRYTYFTDAETNLIRAQIMLPDNRVFVGDLSVSHEQAAGSAAKKVYMEVVSQPDLKNLRPPPHQWFANQQNLPRGPPSIRPPMMPNFHPKTIPGPPASFQQWHGKVQQNPVYQSMQNNQVKPQSSRPQNDSQKQEIKNSTTFVPLQAQKKSRKVNASQLDSKPSGKEQAHKEMYTQKKESAAKKVESVPKEKTTRESDAQRNSQTPQSAQKSNRQKRSRVAAKFGGAPNSQPSEAASKTST